MDGTLVYKLILLHTIYKYIFICLNISNAQHCWTSTLVLLVCVQARLAWLFWNISLTLVIVSKHSPTSVRVLYMKYYKSHQILSRFHLIRTGEYLCNLFIDCNKCFKQKCLNSHVSMSGQLEKPLEVPLFNFQHNLNKCLYAKAD